MGVRASASHRTRGAGVPRFVACSPESGAGRRIGGEGDARPHLQSPPKRTRPTRWERGWG
jgi:hypothetical protein